MARRDVDILLIGGGAAGASAAQALRDEGFEGSVLLVGRELDPPYHRPPCSKGYLRGDESREDVLTHPAAWWEEHGVELLTRTSVLGLDPETRTATLSTKDEVGFGHALLATGAMVRRLPVDGAQLDGLHYLRTLGTADAIRDDVESAEAVVCIGGSYIGSEVAASLTEIGKRVTVVMQERHTLQRQFGEQVGRYLQGVLQAHGIEIVAEDEVERFEGDGDRVARVVTKGGRTLPAQAVVLGVGVTPDVMLARKAGLEIGELGGVRCDDRLRSSAEAIYAAGDICEYDSVVHGRVLRVEHEEVAIAQGAAAARTMLGADRPYDVVPYFFSDLSDWVGIEYVGPAQAWDEEVVHGSIEDGEFAVWYLEAGRVRAMLSVNGGGDVDRGRELIVSGEPLA